MTSIWQRTSAEWNAPVYRPGTSDHLESYFLKGNDPQSKRAYWLKFTVYAPKGDPSQAVGETWAVVFDTPTGLVLAAKEVFPIADCTIESGQVEIGGCSLRQDGTSGSLTAPDGTPISWDIAYDADSEPMVPFPWAWMYTAGIPKTKTVTPHPDVRHRGSLRVGEQTWSVDGWYGMQGHNWGREHAFRYAWLHCNLFEEDGAAMFEGFSARLKLGPFVTPPISGGILWLADGSHLAFNGWRAMRSPDVRIEHTDFTFAFANDTHHLAGRAHADADWMAGLVYRNPDGTVSNCLNSKTANLQLTLTGPDGGERRFTSERGTALETLTQDDDHPVRMQV